MELQARKSASLFTLAWNRCGWRMTRAPRPPRAFLHRRGGMGAPRWSTVRLQWRSSARQPAHPICVEPRRYAAGPSWLTFIHLHVVHPGTPSRWLPASGRDVAFASRVAPARSVATSHGLARPPQDASSQAATRAARTMAAALPSRSRMAGLALPAAPGHAAPSPFASRAPRRDPDLRAGSRRGSPPASGRAAVSGIARAAGLAPAWKPGALAPRPALPRERAVTRTAAPVSAIVPWQRQTVPLVWRGQSGMQAKDSGRPAQAAAHANLSADAAAPAERLPSSAPPAPAAPAPGAIAAQLRAGQLDPALADRLATEVIRRVERSMRIERERRGH